MSRLYIYRSTIYLPASHRAGRSVLHRHCKAHGHSRSCPGSRWMPPARQARHCLPQRGRPLLGISCIDPRVLPLIAMALVVGSTGAGSAWLLVKLIALVTNLAYYGRLTTLSLPIAGTPLGPLAALVPVAGCLVIGRHSASARRRSAAMAFPRQWASSSAAADRAKVALLKPLSRRPSPSAPAALRGRGADHHDGRCAGLALRPALPSERCRAQDDASSPGPPRE